MASSSRRLASACAWIAMNSLPRWLISMTDMPEPCQSSISSRAFSKTCCGRTAGPALKLNTLPTFTAPLSSCDVGTAPSSGLFVRPFLIGLLIGLFLPAFICIRVNRIFFGTRIQPFGAIFGIDDFLQPGQFFIRPEIDQGNALRGPAHFPDFRDPRANQHAAGVNQHDLVLVLDEGSRNHIAVAGAGLDRDHALGTPAVAGVFGDQRTLAEALLGGSQYREGLVLGHPQRNHLLPARQPHAPPSPRHPPPPAH